MPAKKKPSVNRLVGAEPTLLASNAAWRAEDDHRTLTKAGEIKADRERMKAVKDHHKKMSKHMEKACK